MRSPTRRIVQLLPLLSSCFLLAVFVPLPAVAAQEEGLKGVQVEASGLWTSLVGDAFPFQETGPGGSLGIFHRWPTGVSLGVAAMRAQPEDFALPADDVRRHMSQWAAYAEVRYSLTELTPVRPYLGGRVGWTKLDDERQPATTGSGVLFGLTAGAEIRPSDRFAFRLAATGGGLTVADFFEEDEVTNAGTWTAEAGISIFLGSVQRVSDTDGDGVRDAQDDCARTPSGVGVDSRGCAIDADRDAIGDYRDECLGTPSAPVTDRGCVRDADSDGVHDGVDACPDTPQGREVDDEGCPEDEIEGGARGGGTIWFDDGQSGENYFGKEVTLTHTLGLRLRF